MKDFGLVVQKNLRENCPMNYALVINASCLTPDNISQKKETAILKFGKIVTAMYETQLLYAEKADKAKDHFEYFIDSEGSRFAEELSAFDVRKDRLDAFFRNWLNQNSKYSALWKE